MELPLFHSAISTAVVDLPIGKDTILIPLKFGAFPTVVDIS